MAHIALPYAFRISLSGATHGIFTDDGADSYCVYLTRIPIS